MTESIDVHFCGPALPWAQEPLAERFWGVPAAPPGLPRRVGARPVVPFLRTGCRAATSPPSRR